MIYMFKRLDKELKLMSYEEKDIILKSLLYINLAINILYLIFIYKFWLFIL